jgi:hypothetical protein
MAVLTRDDLKELVTHPHGPSVSIFMPTHRAGREMQQDSIRLSNLLHQAEEQLTAQGMRAAEAREMLDPARDLVEDATFWRHQSEGLAIFRSPAVFRVYRFPIPLDEYLSVSTRLHVKPLMPLLIGDERFFVLALSQNSIRLLEGSRFTLAEVDLPGAPESVTETEGYGHPETDLQVQALSPPSSGTPQSPKSELHRGKGSTAIVHGHGSSRDADTRDLERYFRRVDKSLMKALQDERAPLILAGVDYLRPIYKEITKYPQIMEQGVSGNAERLKHEELHAQAWRIVQDHLLKAQELVAAQYREGLAKGRGSHALAEILPAAYQGRIAALFVPIGVRHWGRFIPEAAALEEHDHEQPGDDELLDLVSMQTFLNGGVVYAVKSEEVPDGRLIAATFRY